MKKNLLFISLLLSLNALQAMQKAGLAKNASTAPVRQQTKSNLANTSAALAEQKKAAATPAIAPAATKTANKPVAKPQENFKATPQNIQKEPAKKDNFKPNPTEQKKSAASPAITPATAKTTSTPTANKPVAKPQENLKAKVKSDITGKKDSGKPNIQAKKSVKGRSAIQAILPTNEIISVYGNQIYVAKKDAQGAYVKVIDDNGNFKNFYDKNFIANQKYRVRAKKRQDVKIDPTKVVPIGHQILKSGKKEQLYFVLQKNK